MLSMETSILTYKFSHTPRLGEQHSSRPLELGNFVRFEKVEVTASRAFESNVTL